MLVRLAWPPLMPFSRGLPILTCLQGQQQWQQMLCCYSQVAEMCGPGAVHLC